MAVTRGKGEKKEQELTFVKVERKQAVTGAQLYYYKCIHLHCIARPVVYSAPIHSIVQQSQRKQGVTLRCPQMLLIPEFLGQLSP